MKVNKKLLWTLPMTIASVAAPIAAVVSCGKDAKPNVAGQTPESQGSRGLTTFKSDAPFADVIGNALGNGENVNFLNQEFSSLTGTITPGVGPSRKLDPGSGYNRQSEIDSPEKAGVMSERMIRMNSGIPIYPNMDCGDLWNWSPDGALIHQTTDEAKAFATSDTSHTIPNGKNNGSEWGWGFTQNDRWWQPRDWKYTRATIRDIAPYTFGEKLKPTQSTYAPFSWFTSTARNAGTHLGIMGKNDGYSISDFWNYTRAFAPGGTSSQEWIQIPDGNIIDTAHKNGTYVLGNVNWTGKYTLNLALRKNAAGEYPFIKSLVNVADFYGFDGWIFDNEWAHSDSSTSAGSNKSALVSEFFKAYFKYARDINPYPTSTGLTKDIYTKYKFNHRPQMLSIYQFPESQNMFELSDLDFHCQTKGTISGQNPKTRYNTWGNVWQAPTLYDSSKGETLEVVQRKGGDIFSVTDGFNPGEGPGLADLKKGTKQVVNNSPLRNDQEYLGGIPEDKEQYQFENRAGLWMWLYTEEVDSILRATYSSAVGDPRYSSLNKNTGFLDSSKTSLSDGFQEKTGITGRKPWGTTFNTGKGDAFNLWGGKDLKEYVNRGEFGWRHQGLQSFLPTYKWIVDEYDENGQLLTDPQRLNADGVVDRQVTPAITDTTKNNWLGGSLLNYSGTLAKKGMSFENKLYASSIPVKSGDKFKIVVKDSNITPDLLLWTHDGDVTVHSPYHNGEEGFDQHPTQTPWGDELYNRGVYNYVNESSWNVTREKQVVKMTNRVALGNSGWSEVEYDLSAFANKTIMDIGVKATAPANNYNFTGKLELGKMAFEPQGYNTAAADYKINMSDLNTDFVWDLGESLAARISWEADKRANTYMVFKADANWNLQNLTWVDARTSAYIDHIAKTTAEQNVVIVALDDAYNVVATTKATVKTGVTGGTNA